MVVKAGRFSFLARIFGPPEAAKGYQLAENYRVLRDALFSTKREAMGVVGAASPEGLWAVVMETGYPEGVATLAAVADGSVSLYFSQGGGVIGLGAQKGPRQAARVLLEAAPAFWDRLEVTTKFPLPREGHVRFYFLTPDSAHTAEAGREELGAGRHPLCPLFERAQELVTEILLAEGKLNEK